MKSRPLLSMLAVCAMSASAGTIYRGSGIPGTWENGSGATFQSPYWSSLLPALWESIQPDSGSPEIANGTIATLMFGWMDPGGVLDANLQVLVDDAAIGSINGHTLFNNVNDPIGAACSSTLPNCITPLQVDITPWLISGGSNYVSIIVEQLNGGPFGAAALITLHTADVAPVSAPEPGTMVLLGAGLIGLVKLYRISEGKARA